MAAITGETLQERSKGKDVRLSNIVAAKVQYVVIELKCIRALKDCLERSDLLLQAFIELERTRTVFSIQCIQCIQCIQYSISLELRTTSAKRASHSHCMLHNDNDLSQAIAQAVRTSLGPRGMDKLMQLENGEVLISNDGATILSRMKVLHPAAKMLVELSQSQDTEAGDGTTSVVVLAGALLEACSSLLSKGIHPTAISASFLKAADHACATLEAMSKPVDLADRHSLLSAVETCLSSKVVAQDTDLLAPIAVDSVLGILQSPSATNVDLRDIRMVLQMGGTVDDTELVHGLVLHKGSTKTAGGPSQMPNAKIALLQYCLSAPKTDLDNNVVVSDYAAMDRILREERKYLLQQCKLIKKSGANVVLIQKSILRDAYNELSLHFLAKMGILCVTDIERSDVDFICRTLGCTPIAHASQLCEERLGRADHVGDVSLDGSVVVKFTGVASLGRTMTVLLRGSNDLVLQEASRLNDLNDSLESTIPYSRMFVNTMTPFE
jgi:T-complex protein 1 subunit delta